MSTGNNSLATIEDREVEYIPFGEREPLKLTIAQIRRFICKPTKANAIACDEDIVNFMMLCKARALNPWVSDAYLVGYDEYKDQKWVSANFTLITAVQALFKRAEANENFDGMEYGVIVTTKGSKELTYRQGDFYLEDEILLGGWARVYRKDNKYPIYDALKLTTFNTGRSRWKADPGGMIVKCAQASVLRTAFPTQTGGLYIREELDHVIDGTVSPSADANHPPPQTRNLESVAERLRTEQTIPRREEQREEIPRGNGERRPAPGRQAPPQQEQQEEERDPEPTDDADRVEPQQKELAPARMPELQSFIDTLSVIDNEKGINDLLAREFPVGHERSNEELTLARQWIAFHKKHFMVSISEDAHKMAGRIKKIGTEAGLKKLIAEAVNATHWNAKERALFDQTAIERRDQGF